MKKPSLLPVIIGTGFGSGFSPFAPGTAGALLATLIWFGLSYLVSSVCLLWLTVALILVFTLAGIWAANRLEASWGEDPSRVVVDEMVGVWIALLAAPAGHVWYALGAFVLFRLFDIFKPLGIRRMESMPGGNDGRYSVWSLRIYNFDCGKMDNQLKSNGKGVSWRHSVWIFFKAQISAQFASFVDFLVTILLVKAFAVFYLYATFTGSVVGGIVNCAINYGWVFHAEDCKKTHVAVKYLFVWGGSIILNAWGTFALTEWLTGMTWVNGLLGYYIDNVFILSKIIVAVLVAFFWNYHLQRFFVYRNHNIKGFLKHYLENKKDEYEL